MKKKLFLFALTFCLSICISTIAYADLDLELDDAGGSGPMKEGFVTLKGGLDMMGEVEIEVEGESDDSDIKNGFSVSIELGKVVRENVAIGVGATYQLERGIDEDTGDVDPKFNFVPIFGLVKFWTDAGDFFPYGTVHIGYNLFMGNEDFKKFGGELEDEMDLGGGLYWGLGGGIMLANGVQFELLYSVNNGTGEIEDYDVEIDVSYSKVTISAGISF